VVLSLLATAACGFTPVYGPGGAGTRLQGRVTVVAPQTVAGFRLRTRLEDQFGRGGANDLVLTVTLAEKRESAAITPQGDITRFSLLGTADWTLTSGTREVATGRATSFTSYSATGSTVATQSAETDARTRLSVTLADLILADVLLVPLP
jgi:LPS-assembly lipoprotein